MSSFLGVPIEVRGRISGNLYLTNRQGGHGFTDDDVELVTTLAAAAGVAIDNARLHEEVRQRERWLEATRDMTGALLTQEQADVLALIVARARELAEAEVSTLVVPTLDGELVGAAVSGQVLRTRSHRHQ